jgi:double-GTPase-like protein
MQNLLLARAVATGTCDQSGCTVADTSICLLSHVDLRTCPHFLAVDSREGAAEPVAPTPVLTERLPMPGSAARRFPAGLELGTEEAAEIMRPRYAYLVGILGSWDAGKTCFLLSLYLMASRGALPPAYLFAGSQTLQGFEARARHLRKWMGGPLPEQLADHTNLADPRQPAFLHLALRETGGAKRFLDVILTDLPGEWSRNLVDRAAKANQFTFLHRADGIIVVVDGPLLNSRLRHSELQRSKHLLERLVQSVGVDTATPLVLLVSKCDVLQVKRPVTVDELEQHAKVLGFSPEVVLCAAFSRTPETVPNGLGVFEALAKILDAPGKRQETAAASNAAGGGRAFLSFG